MSGHSHYCTLCLFNGFEVVRLWRFGRLQEVKFDLLLTGSSFPDSVSSFCLR